MEYGCIGEKLTHSFSKIIHNKLTDYDYILKEIPKWNLRKFMLEKNFKAINVTIPYKQDVMEFLDVISDTAQSIGAVNTVVNKNGRLYGYNTDYLGMISLIKHNEIGLKGKKVLILGSGGTSKTAFAVAKQLECSEAYRLSRKGGEGLITYSEAEEKHSDAQIIINTTPCGMYPNIGESAVDINKFPRLEGVVDAVYNPLKSQIVVEALNKGIKAVGGLYMLVAQAVYACEKFTDSHIDEGEISRIYNEILAQKQNIVLVGMPSSGKTTVGKILAGNLGKEFLDTDDLIVEKAGSSIPEIFSSKGEKGFRELEAQVIREVSSRQGAIISTGGGAVLNPQSVELLKGNGVIVFIDRSIEKLIATKDRPLSSNREDLEKRYNERYPIYCQSADFRVENNGELNDTVMRIKEVLKSEDFSN